ncbi:MAG: hypothetical protein HeimC3_01610 [Candidatus Heimdallarchaeota archaeon LC_3]|nr:MAG: hypothetical protein HeimC3_01610 [Candidatus Heimdallarchaeota archaeon LC_3]
MILGSIAIATDPASTSQVIGEYKTKGDLSQTLLFAIAFDDILGIIFVNIAINFSRIISKAQEGNNKALHEHIVYLEYVMTLIIILFFIFIGLTMKLDIIFSSELIIILIYLIFRAIGKDLGVMSAAKIGKFPKEVSKNLPLTLIPQAGVTIGLIALASNALISV